MYQKTTLDNGLRILTSSMPHTRSVSLSFYTGAGSRYEEDREAGISHFIEHLMFKGTQRRPTSKEVSEAIESVGGVLNGGTDRELTIYWSKVPRPHFPLALDVLVDMLRNSKFDAADVVKERQVVIEEINMVNDSPHQRVDVLIDEVVWPGQPLGREIGGSRETVSSFERAHAVNYLAQQYGSGNTVVSVAGNISHDEVVDAVSKALGDWRPATPRPFFPALNGQHGPRVKVEYRRTEQAYLILAVPGVYLSHPDQYALNILNIILGGGMSSRLFMEIREKRGLAYDVYSYNNHLLDTGAFAVFAGVDPKRIGDALQAILQELARIRDDVREEEVQKAKDLTKGRMLLRMEDTRSVSSWLGSQEALLGRVKTVDEAVQQVDAVPLEDVQRVARQLLVQDKLNLAVVGPYKSDKRFLPLLKM
ncbi:MAG: pitrilysin family protein [Dehalococcoidia bacterium]|nr:pitrilysin family protein [Dehalococcoidia bacterium]